MPPLSRTFGRIMPELLPYLGLALALIIPPRRLNRCNQLGSAPLARASGLTKWKWSGCFTKNTRCRRCSLLFCLPQCPVSSGSGRSALQFQRKAASEDSEVARAVRQGKQTRESGSQDQPGISAERIGTTRSRANFFLNRFRKLGFIEYNGGIQVHNTLLNIFLQERRRRSF